MHFSRLAKRNKQNQDLPFTSEETKQIIEKMNQDLLSLSVQIGEAAQNENRALIMQLIDEAKNINEDINKHESFLNKLQENPDEYQLLMW
jgi:seryl-tRNA synthetase